MYADKSEKTKPMIRIRYDFLVNFRRSSFIHLTVTIKGIKSGASETRGVFYILVHGFVKCGITH